MIIVFRIALWNFIHLELVGRFRLNTVRRNVKFIVKEYDYMMLKYDYLQFVVDGSDVGCQKLLLLTREKGRYLTRSYYKSPHKPPHQQKIQKSKVTTQKRHPKH